MNEILRDKFKALVLEMVDERAMPYVEWEWFLNEDIDMIVEDIEELASKVERIAQERQFKYEEENMSDRAIRDRRYSERNGEHI